MPEEDEISLIVPGDHATAFELRIEREDGAEDTTYLMTEASVEAV